MGIGRKLKRAGSVFVVIAVGLASSAVHAGTVIVEVRERGGRAIQNQKVWMRPHGSDPLTRSFAPTESDGKAVFDGVVPGTYTFRFGRPFDPDLVPPDENPWVDAPVITVAREDSVVEITVEFWRGLPIMLDVRSLHTDLPTGKIVLRHVETSAQVEHPFGPRDGTEKHVDQSKVEGRWEAVLDAPPGFVVSDLTVNGEAIPGGTAEVDSSADPRTQFVHWELYSPCEVWGKLLPMEGSGTGGVTVTAHLVEPGPWLESERARGRAHDRVPPYRWEPTAEFHIRLPEGVWRIQPEGDSLENADPPFVELQLTPGQIRRQDFAVTTTDDGDSTTLVVTVVTPDGRQRVADAVVALFPEGRVEDGEPIREERTPGVQAGWRSAGKVRFKGLAAGTYEIVAGHADWLDGHETVVFDPEENDGYQSARVRVRTGATLRGLAVEHDGGDPVPGVEVALEWMDEEFPSPLADERLDEERRLRHERTDAIGYVSMHGLAEGTYRLTARVTGEQQMTRYVRIRHDGESTREEIELRPVPPREYEVDLVVHEGASITGTVQCDDQGPLPPAASFRVYAASASWAGFELGPGSAPARMVDVAESIEDAVEPDPELTLDDVLLHGPHLNEFNAGPLERGQYLLAIRPQGYEGWAWAYGTDLLEEAALVQLPAEQSTGVGAIEALCSPAVVVRPRVISGAAIPDMKLGRYEVASVSRRPTGDVIPVHPVVEARRGHVLVRGLDESTVDLTLTIRHPYLIPSENTLTAKGLELPRGSRPAEKLVYRDVGGALRVRTTSPAAQLTAPEGPVIVALQAEGQASFGGVPAGIYVLEPCETPDCAAVAGSAHEIEIERNRTRHFDLDEKGAAP